MQPLEIVLKEGPVFIRSLGGSGVDNTFPLWDAISASEFFPEGVDSGGAFYFLTLRKSVSRPDEVATVEAELVAALRLLSTAWPFAGGSFIVLETRELIVSNRFESNAERVCLELLAAEGKVEVAARATMFAEAGAMYERPPLKVASAIAVAAMGKRGLRRLLEYHQAAWAGYYHRAGHDRSSWFIDLYKVRDLIVKLYGKRQRAISALNIDPDDWGFFEKVLNTNNLRHAEVADVVPDIPRSDVDRLYKLARLWTQRHLEATKATTRIPAMR